MLTPYRRLYKQRSVKPSNLSRTTCTTAKRPSSKQHINFMNCQCQGSTNQLIPFHPKSRLSAIKIPDLGTRLAKTTTADKKCKTHIKRHKEAQKKRLVHFFLHLINVNAYIRQNCTVVILEIRHTYVLSNQRSCYDSDHLINPD